MTQAGLTNSGFYSVQWNPNTETIKYNVNAVCSIKVELKNKETYIIVQEGNSKIKLNKHTFNSLFEYKESIDFLISFLEGNLLRKET